MDKIILNDGIVLYCHENDYITKKIKETNIYYDYANLDVLSKFLDKNKNVIDIGANIGNHSIYFSKYAKKVFSFEPVKENYLLFKKNIAENKINNIELFPYAIGDKNGIANMDIKIPGNNGSWAIGSEGNQVNILDGKNINVDNVGFIKIDVEGYEQIVLTSIAHLIDEYSPNIYIEISSESSQFVLEYFSIRKYSMYLTDYNNNFLFIKSENSNLHYAYSRMNMLYDTQKKLYNEISINVKEIQTLKNRLNTTTRILKKTNRNSTHSFKRLRELSSENKNLKVVNNSIVGEKQVLSQEINSVKKILDEKMEVIRTLEQNNNEILENHHNLVKQYNVISKKNAQLQVDSDINKLESQLYMKKLSQITNSKLHGNAMKIQNLNYKLKNKSNEPESFNKYKTYIDNQINIAKSNKVIKFDELVFENIRKNKVSKKTNFSSKNKNEINVAFILDDFTYNVYKNQFTMIPILPYNWKEVFENNEIDLFMCESAWTGGKITNDQWDQKIFTRTDMIWNNTVELEMIIEYCDEKGIPTIFYNKEDPSFFDNQRYNFVKISDMFDHVFTTAVECVEGYTKRRSNNEVYVLPFCAEPNMLNPSTEVRKETISFFGSWYDTHPERCFAMETIFDSLISLGYNLEIYDRNSHTTRTDRMYPKKYQKYCRDAVDFDKIGEYYSAHKMSINISTVNYSYSMTARRLYELALSRTLIISNYTPVIDRNFLDQIIILPRDIEKFKNITDQEIDKMINNAFITALKHFTVSKSTDFILENIKATYRKEKIDVIVDISSYYSNIQLLNSYKDIEVLVVVDGVMGIEYNELLVKNPKVKFIDRRRMAKITLNISNYVYVGEKISRREFEMLINARDLNYGIIKYTSKSKNYLLNSGKIDHFTLVNNDDNNDTSITFILPCYNVEKYLEKCIKSIENCGSSDYEIIIVDDCSTDNTLAIANKISKHNAKIIIASTEKNTGFPSIPKNIGMSLATKKYINFIDPDDYISTQKIDKIINKYPYADAIFCSINKNNEKNEIMDELTFDSSKYIFNQLKLIAIPRVILKRDFIIANDLKFIDKIGGEDYLYLLDMLAMKPIIQTSPEILFTMTSREDSLTTNISRKFIDSSIEGYSQITKFLEENFQEKYIREYIAGHIRWFLEKSVSSLTMSDIIKLRNSSFDKYVSDLFYENHKIIDGNILVNKEKIVNLDINKDINNNYSNKYYLTNNITSLSLKHEINIVLLDSISDYKKIENVIYVTEVVDLINDIDIFSLDNLKYIVNSQVKIGGKNAK